MTGKSYLAIDLGATSGRVILATADDRRLRMETLHRFPNRMLLLGGKYYWNIYALYEEILQGLAIAGQRHLDIVSVGIDTWGVDMVFLAADGTFSGLPRAYRDPYTAGIPEAFFARHLSRKELYARTGIQMLPFNSLFQLCAARHEGCAALNAAARILFIPDALAYLLSGETVCEYTILSTSQFMNPRTKRPDAELLAFAGVDAACFPRVVMPGERIGMLDARIARQTGLGRIPVIAVAEHDTGSAVAAVPAGNERFAYLSSGTWSLMGIELREPLINEHTCALDFTNEGGVDGTTRLLKNITGMWLLEQCRAAWARDGRTYTYDEIVRMTEAEPRTERTIDPDAPEFAAPTDMPEAIRRYCREQAIPLPKSDAGMMRLIFDSLAAKYAEVLGRLRKLAPFPVERLHVIGGGARNALLNRMTAAACGLPVVAGPAEATALGNVMVQARSAGEVGSLQEMREYVRRSVETKIYEPENRYQS